MNRFNKYQKFRQLVQRTARKLAAADCNPLGRDIVLGLWRAEEVYDKLNEKWQRRIDKYVAMRIDQYHTPIVLGGDGIWYSAAEMDSMMCSGI